MIIDELEKKVQGKGVRIVFTEGWDPRVQKAAIDLKNNDVVCPVLLGTPEEIARSLVDAMPLKLMEVFKVLNLL